MRLTFKELKDEIAKIVPKSIDYRVDLEAGNIAIVTPVPEKFGGGDGLVGKIAKKIKRKIKIRPDPSIVKPELEAKSLIESIIPEEAEISQIYFDGCFSEVIIQCQNPGEAVGRRGANVNEIRNKTGWIPKVERTPPIFSKSVHDVRSYRNSIADERKKLLKDFGLISTGLRGRVQLG